MAKMKVPRNLADGVFLGVIVAFVCTALPAQQSATPRRESTYSLTQNAVSVSSDRVLRVFFADFPPGKDWVLGVRTETTATQVKLRSGSVNFDTFHDTRVLRNIQPLDPSLVEVSNEGIRLLRLDTVTGSVILYLEMPAGMTLEVYRNGNLLLRAAVGAGLIVRNGETVPGVPKNAASLVPRLLFPSLEQPTTPIRGPGGKYLISDKLLRSHVAQMLMPDYPAVARAESLEGTVAITIEIDTSGNVTGITGLRGEAVFVTAVEQAVRQWKLRPFVVNGSPVPATAPVIFQFRQGKVMSSILQ